MSNVVNTTYTFKDELMVARTLLGLSQNYDHFDQPIAIIQTRKRKRSHHNLLGTELCPRVRTFELRPQGRGWSVEDQKVFIGSQEEQKWLVDILDEFSFKKAKDHPLPQNKRSLTQLQMWLDNFCKRLGLYRYEFVYDDLSSDSNSIYLVVLFTDTEESHTFITKEIKKRMNSQKGVNDCIATVYGNVYGFMSTPSNELKKAKLLINKEY